MAAKVSVRGTALGKTSFKWHFHSFALAPRRRGCYRHCGIFMGSDKVTRWGEVRDTKVAILIRNVVADHLGVDSDCVSEEAEFMKDFGIDWLDRLELVMVLEELLDLEISDDAIDGIHAVGDLIRLVQTRLVD
jgi:acyl carrier protein